VSYHTRAGLFERFLQWQRLNALGLVAQDEDLQRAIEKMENKDLKRSAKEGNDAPGPVCRQRRE
jgi:hypothetical protein